MTIQKAITQTIKDWDMTPDQINGGNCDNFAGDVTRLLGEGEPIWDDELTGEEWGSHCFIKYKNRYYDAECPQGVNNWQDLPLFARQAIQK